jgi:tetratricopeptide (TPR) repeat protein
MTNHLPKPYSTRGFMMMMLDNKVACVRNVIGLLCLAQLVLSAPAALAAGSTLAQGQAFYNKGYVAKAISAFESAAKQNSKSAEAYLWLAKSLQKQGGKANEAKAIAAYKQTVALNPNQGDAWKHLGELLSYSAANQNQTINAYEQAHGLLPKDKTIWKALGENLTWAARYDEALPFADAAAPAYASDKTWLKTYAFLLLQTGSVEKAMALYQGPLVAATSKDPFIQQGYAISLLKSGHAEEAASIYSAIKANLKVYPMQPATFKGVSENNLVILAGLAYELGAYDEALVYDGSLPAARAAKKDTQLRMARSYGKLQRVPEAVDAFYGLYTRGQLNGAEKVEFADTLLGFKVPASSLPEANLLDTLYSQGLSDANLTPEQKLSATLSLARYSSQQPARFNDTLALYSSVLEQQSDNEKLKTEVVDFLKSSAGSDATGVYAAFDKFVLAYPQTKVFECGYAEVLSWEPSRRSEALERFVALAQNDTANQATYLQHLEEVLAWSKPNVAHMGLYQTVASLNPESKWAYWAQGRTHWLASKDVLAAMPVYETLYNRFPNDEKLAKEYTDLLSSAPAGRARRQALGKLVTLKQANPESPSIRLAYARVLSYEGYYDKAAREFGDIIKANPESVEAKMGKGLSLLWSGQPLAATRFLEPVHEQYPDNDDITVSLAEAEKGIGRYDKALKLLQQLKVKPTGRPTLENLTKDKLLNEVETDGNTSLNKGSSMVAPSGLMAPEMGGHNPFSSDAGSVDSSASIANLPASLLAVTKTVKQPVASNASPEKLQQELDIMDKSLETLKALQQQSKADVDELEQRVQYVEQITPDKMSQQTLQTAIRATEAQANSSVKESVSQHMYARTAPKSTGSSELATGTQTQDAYGQFLSMDDDLTTRGFLGGRTDTYLDSLAGLEEDLSLNMRPTFRTGFVGSIQDGESTTIGLRRFSLPNQLAVSLTPQFRIRGGYALQRYMLPGEGIKPNATTGHQYSFGLTAQPLDRLLLDADVALTQFTQSDSSNVTGQVRAKYLVNDRIKAQVGFRRSPLITSLLSYAGVSPNVGPYAGTLVGQARENAIFTELNLGPWKNVDWNLAYEFALIDGAQVASNKKNQAYSSLGYNFKITPNHAARLSHEFLYFGYAKDTTNGFVDLTGANGRNPVVSLSPLTAALPGTVLGGYFSPESFFLNAARLEMRGNFWQKKLEYRVGGSVGIQNFSAGVKGQSDPTTLATQADGQLVYNINDTFSLYSLVDYLNSGGLFQRWRFGGGLQVRPDIGRLTPVFGHVH